MKLKQGFFTQDYQGKQLLLASGAAAESFCGVARSNETAAFIVNCFKRDMTETEVVNVLLDAYDVDPETAMRDVQKIVKKLNEIGALE